MSRAFAVIDREHNAIPLQNQDDGFKYFAIFITRKMANDFGKFRERPFDIKEIEIKRVNKEV